MTTQRKAASLTPLLISTVLFFLGAYFTFTAVQGESGIFLRVQVEAEIETLTSELEQLEQEVAVLRNKTRRLSDNYLDLDLLDHQARTILGMMRADEILIQ